MHWEYDWRLIGYMLSVLFLLVTVSGAFVTSFVVLVGSVIGTPSEAIGIDIAQLSLVVAPHWVPIGISVVVTMVIFGGFFWLHRWRRNLNHRLFHVHLQEAPDEIERRVTRLSKLVDVPTPAVQVMGTDAPTAFTTGVRTSHARITITPGLVKQLDDEELTAVFAHELSHIKNHDVTVMSIVMVPLVIAEGLWTFATVEKEQTHSMSTNRSNSSRLYGFEGVIGIILGVFAGVFWIVLALVIASFARYRELAADRGAVAITGDPATVAGALETMRNENTGNSDLRSADVNAFAIVPPGDDDSLRGGWRTPIDYLPPWISHRVESLFSFHPDFEHRIDRLRKID